MDRRIENLVTPANDPFGLAMWVVLAMFIIFAFIIRTITRLVILKSYTSTTLIQIRSKLASNVHREKGN